MALSDCTVGENAQGSGAWRRLMILIGNPFYIAGTGNAENFTSNQQI